MVKLDETDAALGETARHQAVRREAAVARMLDTVQIENFLRFTGEIGELRHRRLHAERHFILADASLNLGIEMIFGQDAVQAIDLFHNLTLGALAHAFRVADVMDGIAFGLELDALEPAWQEAIRPLPGGYRLLPGLACGSKHDEAGKVVALGAQAVQQPRTHAGP